MILAIIRNPRSRLCISFALALLFLTNTGCSAWTEPKKATFSNATGAEQFERLLWEAIKAKNFGEVERQLAATFVDVTHAGARDRAGFIAEVRQMDISDYSLGDVQVVPNGNDMVVHYNITLRGTASGKPLPNTPIHMMTVWQQAKKGWTAIAHASVGASTSGATSQ